MLVAATRQQPLVVHMEAVGILPCAAQPHHQLQRLASQVLGEVKPAGGQEAPGAVRVGQAGRAAALQPRRRSGRAKLRTAAGRHEVHGSARRPARGCVQPPLPCPTQARFASPVHHVQLVGRQVNDVLVEVKGEHKVGGEAAPSARSGAAEARLALGRGQRRACDAAGPGASARQQRLQCPRRRRCTRPRLAGPHPSVGCAGPSPACRPGLAALPALRIGALPGGPDPVCSPSATRRAGSHARRSSRGAAARSGSSPGRAACTSEQPEMTGMSMEGAEARPMVILGDTARATCSGKAQGGRKRGPGVDAGDDDGADGRVEACGRPRLPGGRCRLGKKGPAAEATRARAAAARSACSACAWLRLSMPPAATRPWPRIMQYRPLASPVAGCQAAASPNKLRRWPRAVAHPPTPPPTGPP